MQLEHVDDTQSTLDTRQGHEMLVSVMPHQKHKTTLTFDLEPLFYKALLKKPICECRGHME